MLFACGFLMDTGLGVVLNNSMSCGSLSRRAHLHRCAQVDKYLEFLVAPPLPPLSLPRDQHTPCATVHGMLLPQTYLFLLVYMPNASQCAHPKKWGEGCDMDRLTRSNCTGHAEPSQMHKRKVTEFMRHGGGTKARMERKYCEAVSDLCAFDQSRVQAGRFNVYVLAGVFGYIAAALSGVPVRIFTRSNTYQVLLFVCVVLVLGFMIDFSHWYARGLCPLRVDSTCACKHAHALARSHRASPPRNIFFHFSVPLQTFHFGTHNGKISIPHIINIGTVCLACPVPPPLQPPPERRSTRRPDARMSIPLNMRLSSPIRSPMTPAEGGSLWSGAQQGLTHGSSSCTPFVL